MQKTVVERMCVSCMSMQDKRNLQRIVMTEEGIFLDPTGKKNGRGAYVCMNPVCIGNLKKKRALDRSFKKHISDETYDALILNLESLHE